MTGRIQAWWEILAMEIGKQPEKIPVM